MSAEVQSPTETMERTLCATIGAKALVRASMVIPFIDANETLTALFRLASQTTGRLIVAGHATPDLAICAHRANLSVCEVVGESSFSADIDGVIEAVQQAGDCVYLANPNRISGTTFAVNDLERIALAISDGLLIIDEYYYDLCGISASVLLEKHSNIVVIRSMSPRRISSATDAGFLLVSPRLSVICRDHGIGGPITLEAHHSMARELESVGELGRQLKQLHAETLRLGSALTKLGAQCRITPTDFLLVRVANPTEVGNRLAEYRIPVENLDGYIGLRQYLRLQVQSPAGNDRVIEAFSRMTPTLIINRTPERKITRLGHASESNSNLGRAVSPSSERLRRVAVSRVDSTARRTTMKSSSGAK
jgi:histidinol-phosphate/aromatic aminotransferase/cobyric acid decarboxylase-like protein